MQTQDFKGRSSCGGEKNYVKFRLLLPLRRHFIDSLKLEFNLFRLLQGKPKVLVTCMYGSDSYC